MSRARIPISDRLTEMRPMFLAGLPNTEIAAAFDVIPSLVSKVKIYGIETGQLRPSDLPPKVNVQYGSLYRAITPQSAGFRRWVLDNTPAGSTPADFLIAIALDVYHEEAGE